VELGRVARFLACVDVLSMWTDAVAVAFAAKNASFLETIGMSTDDRQVKLLVHDKLKELRGGK